MHAFSRYFLNTYESWLNQAYYFEKKHFNAENARLNWKCQHGFTRNFCSKWFETKIFDAKQNQKF